MMNSKYHPQNRPVFLIVQHLRPGGIEVLALNLLEKLRGRHDIHIVALEGTQADSLAHWPVLQDYKDRLHFLNKTSGLSFHTLLKLLTLFVRFRPQTIHTHHIGPMIYGGLAARLCGICNLIHTEHDGWHLKANGKLQARVMKWLNPSMVAVAEHVGERVAAECNAPMPRIVYNGIDTHKFSEGDKITARLDQGLPREARIIGCAGRMEKVKGHRILIETLPYLPQDVHIAFAGDGSLKEDLIAHAHQLNIADRVHILGRIDDMCSFYRGLDVFCLPSLNEGFPLSPLEAQACGIPAVLSDVGGCSEALCRDTGFLAQAGDQKDLATKLTHALTRQGQDTSPRQFILDHFDLEEIAATYEALYTQTLKGAKSIQTGEMKYV